MPLKQYEGKVMVLVNVASACGLTPHYSGLEKLYKEYKAQGLEVLGFPCNQFGAQEPGSEQEIAEFCDTKYSVTFPMFSKIEVNGDQAHPLYKYLTEEMPNGEGQKEVEWNFAKFLVDRDGKVVRRFHPKTTPDEIQADIAKLLN